MYCGYNLLVIHFMEVRQNVRFQYTTQSQWRTHAGSGWYLKEGAGEISCHWFDSSLLFTYAASVSKAISCYSARSYARRTVLAYILARANHTHLRNLSQTTFDPQHNFVTLRINYTKS
jgi:hypothetical protein